MILLSAPQLNSWSSSDSDTEKKKLASDLRDTMELR